MIKSFKHAGLERFYKAGSKSGIQPAHAAKLAKQLFALNNATSPADMAVFPSWGCHALKGQRAGQYAVWVNGNWRLTFAFEEKDAVIVDYQDYH